MGTPHYNFTYLQPDNQINLVGDTTTFLNEIDTAMYNIESTKGFLVIGDSFSDPNAASWNLWPAKITARTGKPNYNFAKGGAGFIHKGSTGTVPTFAEQVNTASATVSKDMIDAIIVYGGINDYGAGKSQSEFRQGVDALINALNTHYKGVKTFIVPFNCGVNDVASYSNYPHFIHENESYFLQKNIAYVPNAQYWLWCYPDGAFQSDNVHPTEYGQNVICNYMMQIISGCYDGVHKVVFSTPVSGFGASFKGTITFDNGSFNGTINVTSGTAPNAGWVNLLPINHIGFGPNNATVNSIPCYLTNGTFSTEVGCMQLNGSIGYTRVNMKQTAISVGGSIGF